MPHLSILTIFTSHIRQTGVLVSHYDGRPANLCLHNFMTHSMMPAQPEALHNKVGGVGPAISVSGHGVLTSRPYVDTQGLDKVALCVWSNCRFYQMEAFKLHKLAQANQVSPNRVPRSGSQWISFSKNLHVRHHGSPGDFCSGLQHTRCISYACASN